jgi:hypothetical protein
MKVVIKFSTEDCDLQGEYDVQLLLERVNQHVNTAIANRQPSEGLILDFNGNKIGTWGVTDGSR